MKTLEQQLEEQFREIGKFPVLGRANAANTFYLDFISCLEYDGSFDYPFDKLEKIGKIYSPDRRLRIFTWNIPVGFEEHLYYGIVQFYSPRKKNYQIALLNRTDSMTTGSFHGEWKGSLYYRVIETKHAGQKYYTLLSLDLNTPLSNKKVIEVISVDDFDKLYFCKKLLLYNGQLMDRIEFEYNKKVVMTLQYNEKMKMIVFDHLSPSRPSLTGQFEFYGPDFTYDGLKWEKGVWVHYSDIEITD